MATLTARQKQILDFVRRRVRERGYPPSVREIGEAVGLQSSSTVHAHLNRLEEKGLIRRDPTKPRAIELVDEADVAARTASVALPLVGRVTAGSPILAVENREDMIAVPTEIVPGSRGEDHFLLRVQGDSMVEAGILDGDLVIVRRQTSALNGDIVVALVGDEATVKAFYRESGGIRLQPRNSRLAPLIVDDCQVLGKVVGLLRKM